MKKRTHMITTSIVILGMITLINNPALFAQDPGFFLDDWQEKAAEIPTYTLKAKTENPVTVQVNVDMQQKLHQVPDYIYGNNAVTWGGNMNEFPVLLTDINNLNPHVLRWPGGNLSQDYFWNRSSDQRPDDVPDNQHIQYGVVDNNWEQSTNDYYDLLANTNSTGIITVNYAYARYGTGPDPVAAAAHMAADWVRYDNGRSKFWEIGNENFGSWETGYQIDVSLNKDGQPEYINGQLYGQHCRVFLDSMRAAAAEIGVDIKIGVVAYDAETSYDDISEVWNEGMMPEVGDLADYLIVHSYFTPYNEDSPVSTILNSHTVARHIMQTMVSDMAEAGKPLIPVAFTEWNIFAVGSMQQVSYINGMHAALVLGEMVQNKYGLATRWDLTNGWAEGNDHGMFSRGGEPGVDLYNPRPVFYYMYYFQKYFGNWMVHSSVTGNNSVVAYASSFSSGESGIVLINKSRSDEVVEVDFSGFEPGLKYYYHTLTGGDDNGDFSRKVYLNGFGTTEDGGGPNNYESIRAFASPSEEGVKVVLPSLSAVYLMVEKQHPQRYISSVIGSDPGIIQVELSDTIVLADDPTGFTVKTNGTDPVGVTGMVIDPVNARQINLLLGHEILPTDEVTLSYSGDDVTNLDGIALAPFSNEQVTNLLPGAPPIITGAVTNLDGTMVHLTFNKKMKITGSSAGSFVLTDRVYPPTDINIAEFSVDPDDSTMIHVTPEEPLYAEHDLVLSYSGTAVSSTEETLLDPFSTFPVTNLSPGTPPGIVVASVRDQGFTVLADFSKPMNDLSESVSLFTVKANDLAVAIDSIQSSGTRMTIALTDYIRYGDKVTLSYEGTEVTSEDRGVLQPIEDHPVTNTLPEPEVFEIPGRIDAELFTVNQGMSLVQCRDDGGGYNLAQIDPGDWVEYEINVLQSGFFAGVLRMAAQTGPGQLVIYNPGLDVPDLDTVDTPFTGGWQEWRSISCEIPLEEGPQRLRLRALTPGININWLNLEFDRTLEAEFVSAATNGSGDTIEVLFSKELSDPGDGESSGFSVMTGTNPVGVTGIWLNQQQKTTLQLVLETALSADDENITVSYGTGTLQAADHTPVVFFSDMPVVNNVVTSTGAQQIPVFTLYPNPVDDHLTVESNGVDITSIEVTGLTGNRILYKQYQSPQQSVRLSLDLPPGIYLLKTGSSNNLSCSKIIVN